MEAKKCPAHSTGNSAGKPPDLQNSSSDPLLTGQVLLLWAEKSEGIKFHPLLILQLVSRANSCSFRKIPSSMLWTRAKGQSLRSSETARLKSEADLFHR